MGETSAPYNEHCLASSGKHNIAICTLLRSEISPPKELTLFEGDATVLGFLRALKLPSAQRSTILFTPIRLM
jgi:hypothetical protein